MVFVEVQQLEEVTEISSSSGSSGSGDGMSGSRGAMSVNVDERTVVTAAMYDDPYEENPISAAKCLCNDDIDEKSQMTGVTGVESADCESSVDCSVVQETSNCTLTATAGAGNSEHAVVPVRGVELSAAAVQPVRSFELSAEYAGFFDAAALTSNWSYKVAQDDVALQQAGARQCAPRVDDSTPAGGSGGGGVRSGSGTGGGGTGSGGLYDEPWDLRTVRDSIEERLHQSSQKDVVGRVAVDSRPASTDVYAQPRKRGKCHERTAACSNDTDVRASDGPSYGVLCARPSDNGFIIPPPLARRHAGVGRRHNQPAVSTADCRPLDDYDVPWDQKKTSAGHAGQ